MSRSDGVQAEVNVPVSIIFEKLSYDKVSGILSWKGTSKNSGKAAGYYRTNLSGIQYLIVGIGYEGKVYKIFGHRLAWLIVTGVWPDEIDHIDGDGRNNKWENLSNGNRTDNNKNHKRQINNSSGLPGVSFVTSTGKWRVFGNKEGKQVHLKSTRDFFEACCTRKSWEVYNGYSVRHGM